MKVIILFTVFLLSFRYVQAASDKKSLPEKSIYHSQTSWIDQDGKKLKLQDLAGKPVAISMIYMTCKFSCPVTVAHMKDLKKLLPENVSQKVQFILVSFDPKNDTPEVMKKYADKNKLESPQWRFITSKNEEDLRELSTLIDFKYKKTEDGEFEHSFGIVALDNEGQIMATTIGAEMKESDIVPFFKKSVGVKE